MRAVILVIIQLVISLLLVGAMLPAVLYGVVATRSPRTGMALTLTSVLAVFVVLRRAWPRPRRN